MELGNLTPEAALFSLNHRSPSFRRNGPYRCLAGQAYMGHCALRVGHHTCTVPGLVPHRIGLCCVMQGMLTGATVRSNVLFYGLTEVLQWLQSTSGISGAGGGGGGGAAAAVVAAARYKCVRVLWPLGIMIARDSVTSCDPAWCDTRR